MVQMRGIVKRFPGVIANDHVDLDIYPGEIHALLGENGSGKSTLMSILAGLYRPDEGKIIVEGQECEFRSPRDAIKSGIEMVHQHFKLVEPFTVAQNMQLGEQEASFLLSAAGIRTEIREFETKFGLAVDPDAKIWQLSVGEKQRVEIVRALYYGSKTLILDEPTAVLTPQEAAELFVTLKKMAAAGCAIVFITHKLNEVQQVADRVTVLRNGKVSGTMAHREILSEELIWLMVGRELDCPVSRCGDGCGETVLRMEKIGATNDMGRPGLRDISLTVQSGQIFGIAGVAGNGQRELAEVITGLRKAESGKMFLGENEISNLPPGDIIALGVGYVPEDRLGMGLVPNLNAVENMLLKCYQRPEFCSRGLINFEAIANKTASLVKQYDVKLASLYQPVRMMSGGNLQKLLLAREISEKPKLIVVMYPARGLDVGATEAVHCLLTDLRDSGTAIVLISEDLDEILKLADRVGVMFAGTMTGNVAVAETDLHEIGLLMMGLSKEQEGAPDGQSREIH